MTKPAILALADGSIFRGEAIGIDGETVGEVVFNTAMTGYQEILTDPSYARQLVALTYPHIGNTGTTPEDAESSRAWAAGLIIRDLPLLSSSWRDKKPLGEYLIDNKIVAIAGIDTRRLTRILRDNGAQSGCILAGEDATEERALELARGFAGLQGLDLAQEVSTDKIYEWRSAPWQLITDSHPEIQEGQLPHHVVVYDYGVKRNILRVLVARGCRLTVVPAQTPASEVLALNPDGVFLSNGPGDPEPCDYAVAAIKEILATDIPVFGICLGHQLLALASGARTMKMINGHHGANHPVQDLKTGKVMITSQNHGFAVDKTSLPDHLKATHESLFDQTLQGIERTDKQAFGFQGHPEASPGPNDVSSLFDRFVASMMARR
ncbi:glutamine-hydrolyzing carbamoyl-phosphate synthase small subunit [Pseudomonas sp. C27(2019)]|uniref:glutamine-hydrolyzing carbamoyl-phosphate synthase small subunit n=1 Tax=Pseudomonas sp. C27(2019) TaxID=2604941 RepID=UPI001244EE0D|nr:glutamine-hydrolyzing carbamoyl-phosphate synthase small subunit [Pseudomonas sp. C27(2019)]QEY59521.1 glutamine-hydrolyzing carbamoyl-phosphate synthase small subunit [Pseudomonas sp. C27(2019)]